MYLTQKITHSLWDKGSKRKQTVQRPLGAATLPGETGGRAEEKKVR